MSRRPLPAESSALAEARLDAHARAGPVIVLSYAHSGADLVQEALAVGTGLARTAGTGVIAQCAVVAETWRRIEGQDGTTMSPLAAASIRSLVGAQLATILAAAGGSRWCELAYASPSAVAPFLQVFPHARVVCVHRSCRQVVRAGVLASPWGIQNHVLRPYLLAYPGNNVAALAAYWADSTRELLDFEDANRDTTHRARYEDVAAQPGQALAAVKHALRLDGAGHDATISEPGSLESDRPPAWQAPMPTEMIPEPVRHRVARLHVELGYPPLGADG
jgi:hypothetical protein